MVTSSEEMAGGRSACEGESEGVAREKEENLEGLVSYKPTPHLMERRKTKQCQRCLLKGEVTEDKG